MHSGGLAMALSRYNLGELLKQRREKYDGEENLSAWGVSREGFISPKQDGADTSIYNVFYKNDFVFNPARMELNSIALNLFFDKAICSSLYEVFYVSRTDIVLPEYLNLFIKRDEFARKCWFEAIGSARNYFRISNLSEFEIDLPPLPIQQKYVDVYNAMLANQKCYERGLDDLKLSYEELINEYKHKSPKKNIGDIFEEVDNRNEGTHITDVQGINIQRQFMPTVADMNDVNLSKYKLVKSGQFAFSGMQTGRDKCIRIALYDKESPIIISPAYTVLDNTDLYVLSEYVIMWLSRKEIDRLGWFMSDASIRTNLDMDRFYEIKIPVPDIKIQKSIVEIYKAYNKRREINEKLKSQIKDICPILIKGSIEEARKDA